MKEYLRLEELGSMKSPAAASGRLEAAYKKDGIRGFWQARLDDLKHAPYSSAQIHARIGQNEQALILLQEAARRRDPGFLLFFVDPVFDELLTESRSTELLGALYPAE